MQVPPATFVIAGWPFPQLREPESGVFPVQDTGTLTWGPVPERVPSWIEAPSTIVKDAGAVTVPPPGLGVYTPIVAVPAVAIREAATVAVSVVPFPATVPPMFAPFQVT